MSARRGKRREAPRGPEPGEDARPVDPGFLLLLGIVLLFVVHAWRFRFTVDDAFISLQYARNLVEGHGLVFNLGKRVEGYSNFS
jgi:hypothetical protein